MGKTENTETSGTTEIEIEEAEETAEVTMDVELSLQSLEEDEREISQWCIELELEYKELASKRRAIVYELAQVKRTLVELQRLIKANSEKVSTLLGEYNSLAVQMLQVSTELVRTLTSPMSQRATLLISLTLWY